MPLPRPGRLYRATLMTAALFVHTASAADTKAEIDPEGASGFGEIKHAIAIDHMAVTANPHATDTARKILSWGGSAVDAAIAAQLVLGLVEPQSSGIGGGAFVLHWDNQRKKLSAWDGRETAPAAVTPTHFIEGGKALGFFEAVVGGHAVGTPGVIAVLHSLHEQYGKLPWNTLFQPAIKLAREGFAISPRLHTLLVHMPKVAVNPAITAYFFEADGRTPKAVGHVLKNPDYADTLERLAKKGRREFYRGQLARQIVDAVANDPNRAGKLSLDDLKGYRPKERDPVCGNFRQYRVCGMGPPSSGGITVAAILGMLQHLANKDTGAAQQAHLFAESSRLAFADRNHYIGDPDFVEVPTRGLLNDVYLRQRSTLVNPKQGMQQAPHGIPPGAKNLSYQRAPSPELPSTSHLSLVDGEGNIVSMTTSIETAFGSRIMVGGFLLNNQLTDFSFVPEESGGTVANRIEGGKRPRSSMSPTIVFDGDQPRLVIGSPGGTRIINYVARTIWDVLENGLPVAQAIAEPHVVHIGHALELEEGRADPALIQQLQALGHKINVRSQTSGLHAIWIDDRFLEGGADPRREGTIGGE